MFSNLLTKFEGPVIVKAVRKLDPVGAAFNRRSDPDSFNESLTPFPVKGASFALAFCTKARCHDIVRKMGTDRARRGSRTNQARTSRRYRIINRCNNIGTRSVQSHRYRYSKLEEDVLVFCSLWLRHGRSVITIGF